MRGGIAGLAAGLLALACGAKGPPHPPLSKSPAPVQGLFLRQSGDLLELSWARPAKRANGQPLEGPLTYAVLARPVERPAAPSPPAGEAPSAAAGTTLSGSSAAPAPGPAATEGGPAAWPPYVDAAAAGPLPGRSAGSDAPTTTEDAFLKGATVVARVPGTADRETDGVIAATVPLSTFQGVRLGRARIQLAVVVTDTEGRKSRPRPILELDPIDPLPPPLALSAEPAPEGISLKWSLPAGLTGVGVDVYRDLAVSGQEVGPGERTAGTTPAPAAASEPGRASGTGSAGGAAAGRRHAGRGRKGSSTGAAAAPPGKRVATGPRPLAGTPFPGEGVVDSTARMGLTYVYRARIVSIRPGKGLRESPPTADVRVEYLDRFPPAPPGLVTADIVPAAAREGESPAPAVVVAWSPPLDPDVAGYRVYRTASGGEFALAAQVGSGETSWTDHGIRPGLTYRYCVTAIDGGSPPNESARSAPAEVETGPQGGS